MYYQIKLFLYRYLLPLIAIFLNSYFSSAIADDSPSESINQVYQQAGKYETGMEIGVLIFLGADFRLFYREYDSPWVFGMRYLNIKDDFINESAAGFPNDESDKQYTKRAGIYLDYLFINRANAGSYYLSGALYQTTKKIECDSESDSDSATSLYFGGGYQGSFGSQFGYKIGVLLSPFVSLEHNTTICSSEESGDFDLDVSLTFKF